MRRHRLCSLLPIAIYARLFFLFLFQWLCPCHQIKLKEVLREHFARHEAGGKSTRAIVFTQFRDSVEVGGLCFFGSRFRCRCRRRRLRRNFCMFAVTTTVSVTVTVTAAVTAHISRYRHRCRYDTSTRVTGIYCYRCHDRYRYYYRIFFRYRCRGYHRSRYHYAYQYWFRYYCCRLPSPSPVTSPFLYYLYRCHYCLPLPRPPLSTFYRCRSRYLYRYRFPRPFTVVGTGAFAVYPILFPFRRSYYRRC